MVPAVLWGCGASPPGPSLPGSSGTLSSGLLLFITLAVYKVTSLNCSQGYCMYMMDVNCG